MHVKCISEVSKVNLWTLPLDAHTLKAKHSNYRKVSWKRQDLKGRVDGYIQVEEMLFYIDNHYILTLYFATSILQT